MNTTRISKTLQKALNDQITLEAFSAQIYLMLACWADENQLDGVKNFMMKHSQEERVHMAKIIEYVQERGGTVKIEAIKKPGPEPKNVLECFQAVLKQEIENTESIYKIVKMSMEEAKLAGGANMSDAAKFDLNKTIGNTGQDFPTADQINPLAE